MSAASCNVVALDTSSGPTHLVVIALTRLRSRHDLRPDNQEGCIVASVNITQFVISYGNRETSSIAARNAAPRLGSDAAAKTR